MYETVVLPPLDLYFLCQGRSEQELKIPAAGFKQIYETTQFFKWLFLWIFNSWFVLMNIEFVIYSHTPDQWRWAIPNHWEGPLEDHKKTHFLPSFKVVKESTPGFLSVRRLQFGKECLRELKVSPRVEASPVRQLHRVISRGKTQVRRTQLFKEEPPTHSHSLY